MEDGTVKWCNGQKQGYWELREGGKLLCTKFNNVEHKLVYQPMGMSAHLVEPVRNPASRMWIQLTDRGTLIVYNSEVLRVIRSFCCIT